MRRPRRRLGLCDLRLTAVPFKPQSLGLIIVPGARHTRLSILGGDRRSRYTRIAPRGGRYACMPSVLEDSLLPEISPRYPQASFDRRRPARVLSFLPRGTRTCAAPPRHPAPPPAVPDAHRCRCETTSRVRDVSRPNPSPSRAGAVAARPATLGERARRRQRDAASQALRALICRHLHFHNQLEAGKYQHGRCCPRTELSSDIIGWVVRSTNEIIAN